MTIKYTRRLFIEDLIQVNENAYKKLTKLTIDFDAMDYWYIIVLLGLLDLRCCVRCLFVTDINVPQIVDFRDNVTLSCSYDMNGHTLNSVKWYKDSMEFFRYSPLMHPVYMKFPVTGVQLTDNKNFCNESTCRVELTLLNVKSSGTYTCEVSGDAPHFKLTAKSANMTVAALPQNNPLINNFHSIYRFNDFVRANCTTDFSSLPAKLTWYINGEEASYIDLQPVIETTIPGAHEYNLRRQAMQLNFYANDPRFHRDGKSSSRTHTANDRSFTNVVSNSNSKTGGRVLELRCLAEIENFPELRRETILNAMLIHDDDLRNQKLVNSGATIMPYSLPICLQQLIVLLLITYITAAAGQLSSKSMLNSLKCNHR